MIAKSTYTSSIHLSTDDDEESQEVWQHDEQSTQPIYRVPREGVLQRNFC